MATEDKPKFTPGPWVIETETRGYEVCTMHGVGNHFTAEGDEKTWVYVRSARVIDGTWHWPSDEEQAANAHAISAAPDMYEALKAARETLMQVCEGQHEDNVCCHHLHAVEAALAKAEGRQS